MRKPFCGGATALPAMIDPASRHDLPASGAARRPAGAPGRRRRALLALVAWPLAIAVPRLAGAQLARSFPASARLGRLEIRNFPEAFLDGESVRLTAGARVHDTSNRIVMPATLSGTFDALVERDASGQVVRAWILTPDELAAARQREKR